MLFRTKIHILVNSTQSGPGSKKIKQRFFNEEWYFLTVGYPSYQEIIRASLLHGIDS